MLRSTAYAQAGAITDPPRGVIILSHDERHLRRKLLHLDDGEMVMLDLKEPVLFAEGDRLLLEDGDTVEIRAAEERLYEVRAQDRLHLIQLAWHMGNRHLAAQIEDERILILRDHVIKDMLIGLGAEVIEVVEAFQPVRGAYHAAHGHHQHSHGHG